MTNADPIERLGIKVIIHEQDGIRRFLYPIQFKLPTLYRRSLGKLALAEADGTLLPSHVAVDSGGDVYCAFAISMAPFETRELYLVRAELEQQAQIPDALNIEAMNGGLASHQERVVFSFDQTASLASVVYDSIEHLAAPITITLDGGAMTTQDVLKPLHEPASSLYALYGIGGSYRGGSAAQTRIDLTCCKSWVKIGHVLNASEGQTLRFSIPLAASMPTQTCDFGVGNGAYGKLQTGVIDSIILDCHTDNGSSWRYAIGSQMASGLARQDYAGIYRSLSDLAPHLWLHWNEPDKALALAITTVPQGVSAFSARLMSNGLIDIDFTIGKNLPPDAYFEICCHFLNAIPPIAAATNPASILCEPKITLTKLQ